MFFQSTAHSYVCPMIGTRRRQPLFDMEKLQHLLSEKLFLQTVAKLIVILLFVVLGAQLWMGIIMDNIDESISLAGQECHALFDENIALRAEKAYLLSPQRIEKMAAEKLAMFVAGDEQIRHIN